MGGGNCIIEAAAVKIDGHIYEYSGKYCSECDMNGRLYCKELCEGKANNALCRIMSKAMTGSERKCMPLRRVE